MQRHFIFLAVFISVAAMPLPAFADRAAEPATTDLQNRHWVLRTNDGGFYIDLPAAGYNQLIGLIGTQLVSLTHRKNEITKYLDEHRMDARDTLIAAILPGGFLYAAARNADLEQARTELAQVTEDMLELSRDLLALQAEARELIMAELQR